MESPPLPLAPPLPPCPPPTYRAFHIHSPPPFPSSSRLLHVKTPPTIQHLAPIITSDIVIPRLKAVAGHARLLVMLRDPVKRAYSQYHMALDPEGTPAQLKSRGVYIRQKCLRRRGQRGGGLLIFASRSRLTIDHASSGGCRGGGSGHHLK